MGAWFPDLNPFAGMTDLIKLGLVVVLLFALGLMFLSGKLNANIPPPWSTGLGLVCLGASFYLIYLGRL